MYASVSGPSACVLSERRYVLGKTNDALIPGLPLRVVCECRCVLLILEPRDGDELAGVHDVPEQFSRKVAFRPGLLIALPVLVASTTRILFTHLRLVGGHSHEHLRSPLLCQERTLLTTESSG